MAHFTLIRVISFILLMGISPLFAAERAFNQEESSPISLIPTEVVVNSICPYLSLKELLTFGEVSKKFYAIATKRMGTFENLTINQKILTQEAVTAIAKRFTGLKKLELTQCQLGSNHTAIIQQMTTLTFLDLSHNNINDTGGNHLASLPQLTYLKLYNNNLGNEGIKKLATHPSLTELNLGSNQIQDEGIKYLVKYSKATLNVLNNPFSLELKWKLLETTQLRLNI